MSNASNFVVKKTSDGMVDVFCDKGWTAWSRFAVEKKGGRLLLRLVKGSPMKQDDFKQLYSELNK